MILEIPSDPRCKPMEFYDSMDSLILRMPTGKTTLQNS